VGRRAATVCNVIKITKYFNKWKRILSINKKKEFPEIAH
jgi:hypothetical protein